MQNERAMGVLLEQIDGKIDLLAEGHQTLDKKIDDLHDEMNERFKEVDYKFGIVLDELHVIRDEKISRDEFVVLEKRISAIEKKIA